MKKRKFLSGICWIVLFIFFSTAISYGNLLTIFHKKLIAKTENLACIEGKAECVMDCNSRRVLYESKGDLRLPMASTTKILTAITVLEHNLNIQEKIKIPDQAVGVEGSSVYLKKDETYTIEDLLYGLMLRSGNDCATALALYCSGTVENFSILMNKTAEKAGALHSHFSNPHGLPHPNHFTTARDLCYITAYAMQNTIFQKIVSTTYYQPCNWKNKNKMLTMYEGANGGKTGYTKQAGRCLVSTAAREGLNLVCCVLNCPTTYERSIQLLDDAFSAYKNVQIIYKDRPYSIYVNDREYLGYPKEDIYYPLMDGELDLLEIKIHPNKKFKKIIKNEEILGQFEIYLAKQLLFSGNLYKL